MERPTLVVDASVAVKWILPETGHEDALRIQEKYQDEEIDLIAPYLIVAEIANVLWKRESRGDLDAWTAQYCFRHFLQGAPILLDSEKVSASALGLAMAHRRPVYDCLYLAWALEQRCDLVTADERFYNAMGAAFPCVTLLQRENA
jgi:predicted nucleic acid-binding protein